MIETHVSTVFFAADRAYKLLKPIATSFLDHRSVEQRLSGAEAELALNRRMAPDVYLGSADVVEDGRVVDRMVVMRRLPAERRLTEVVAGPDGADCVRAVARAVAVFHEAQPPLPDAAAIAGRDAVAGNWRDNLADMRPLVGDVFDPVDAAEVEELAERYLAHRDPLFRSRLADGFVRDGHGDIIAEDVFCLADGPRIIDCLAFDERLRIADVLADVGFLAMDLERLGRGELAADLLSTYCELTNEHHPASLANHYIAYRAHVRAKVAAIRHGQGDPDAADTARRYHDLCLRRLRLADPRLIMVGGTPGTGKSTLAAGLSSVTGAMVLGTDELRKDLAGRGHLERHGGGADEGIYDPAVTERTYDELLARAGTLLSNGESVIVDGSWNRASLRRQARSVGRDHGASVVELRCTVPDDEARRRVAARLLADDDPSDARPDLVDELGRRYEPWPDAVEIDTTGDAADVVGRALTHRLLRTFVAGS
ncbi:MAG: AAA family ATPase [Acidimicrobiales bacterium]